MGHLKGRFQSLKGLWQQIKSRDDHLRAVEWIRACLVIHTIIHEIEEINFDSEWEEELVADGLSSDSSAESSSDDDNRVPGDIRRESAGQRKRRKVKEGLFASGIAVHR